MGADALLAARACLINDTLISIRDKLVFLALTARVIGILYVHTYFISGLLYIRVSLYS